MLCSNINFLQNLVKIEGKNQRAVITNINTSIGIKPQLSWKKSGDDVILAQCPFKIGQFVIWHYAKLYEYHLFQEGYISAVELKLIE